MFERFTPAARTVVEQARNHARRLGHRGVGTEHLLLSLCSDAPTTGPILESFGLTIAVVEREIVERRLPPLERDRSALAALGIDLDRVRESIEATFGPGALDAGEPPRRRSQRRRRGCGNPISGYTSSAFSPRAKKCLELSLREALRLRHHSIAPEHIGLGILREGEGLACVVLAAHDVSFAALQAQFERSVRRLA
jgi:ATP-dependent Clp protease ATP-binding subunit ClpA